MENPADRGVPVYRSVGTIKMDNGKWLMDNEGMRFAHDFNYFSYKNTIIVNYQLSIVHCASAR